MWNWHEIVDGIDVGYTNLPPFFGQTEEVKDRWRRPSVMLTRASIHSLANKSKDEIIDFLYKRICKAEELRVELREKDHGWTFVPMRKNVPGYVYFMYAEEIGLMKIGCSGNPERRRKDIQREVKCEIKIVCTLKANGMYEAEHEFHELFSCRHKRGEWYEITPNHIKIVHRYLAKRNKAAA